MLESEAYMTYHAYATGEKTLKPKSTKKKAYSESSPKTKLTQASKGKRIKTVAKGDKLAKNKQSVIKSKGLTILYEVALTEAEQIKLATKRSLIQTHSSHASGSGADEGTGSIPGVPDVLTYESDDEQISWKSREEDDDEVNMNDANQGDDDEQTNSDNDGDDFAHPKLSTHDDEERQDDEVNEEESDDESNEDSDKEVQGANIEEEEMDEEATNEEDEVHKLYRDVNINLEGRENVMTDAPLPNVQGTQVTKDTHVIITALINPEGQQQSSSLSSGFTSLSIAANLSELELKKTLIDKMESNKSIHRSNEQKNLYKVLVDAYESDKLILDAYGDTVSFKRRKDNEDKDEEPSAGSNRGSKRRRARKEPESTIAPKEKTSKTSGNSLAQKEDLQESFNELMDTPLDFSAFSLVELEYLFEEVYKETTKQLDWNNPEGQQYPHDLRKTLPLIPNSRDYGHIKWIEDLVPNRMWSQVPISYDKHVLWGNSHWGRKRQQFYGFAANRESARDVSSKRRIIAVTKLEIVDWHNYKHLDWITVRRDDDKLYKFKEGNFNRFRIQDIEDMLLLLVQGVESYQKKLNLTKPDTYRPNLKRREAYTAYSNPRGFIYQNKDKKNRLMHIDELYKFSDGTLNDVRTALNDRIKGIWMEYLP
ncbi:hypothetical protein Tco_0139300 [Tanacetum coccineum]